MIGHGDMVAQPSEANLKGLTDRDEKEQVRSRLSRGLRLSWRRSSSNPEDGHVLDWSQGSVFITQVANHNVYFFFKIGRMGGFSSHNQSVRRTFCMVHFKISITYESVITTSIQLKIISHTPNVVSQR